ncbi:MAG TPA: arylsulfotransferase family protein [Gemmataceae bacterium]|nr:arylsulfotransferase family protein [Gemmataceae bacterium]
MLRKLGRKLVPVLSLLGIGALGYVLGAAVMFYRLPSSRFLTDAFLEADRWRQTSGSEADSPMVPAPFAARFYLGLDKKEKTCDGFTLVAVSPGNQVYLIDMEGNIVHHWTLFFNRIWPHPQQLDRLIPDEYTCPFGLHLFPNGDLLATFHGYGGVAEGIGLAKVDKDSRVLWTYDQNVHHDVDVDDDGHIFLTTQKVVQEPIPGLEFIHTPTLVDFVEMLSADGQPLRKISLLQAFQDSNEYFPILKNAPIPRELRNDSRTHGDLFHTNHVEILRPSLAPKFGLPRWKAGQALISMRNLNAIALLDMESGKLIWATTGPWKMQHDSQFLPSGHVLLFDNRGSDRSSRVLEMDPKDDKICWSYPDEKGEPFHCPERGMVQRLSNGNTFIVDSVEKSLMEVTADHELIWAFHTGNYVQFAQRYAANELRFIAKSPRPQP